LILPFGFYLRRRLPETLHRTDAGQPAEAAADKVSLVGPILLGLGMIMSFTTSTYVLLYMTTYASHTTAPGPGTSFGASVSNGFCGFFFAVLGGWLSDKFGESG